MSASIEDLDAKIAELKKAREAALAKAARDQARIDRENQAVLVGSTPTKKKPITTSAGSAADIPKRPVFDKPILESSNFRSGHQSLPSLPAQAGPSRLSSSLKALRNGQSLASTSHTPLTSSPRDSNRPGTSSVSRSERVASRQDDGEIKESSKNKGKERDEEDLTIVQELQIGPKSFGLDSNGADEWVQVEPNSGIRLSKRNMSHAQVQAYLDGRYYLPPSLLYSVIRLSRDGATYDIPVDGDWLTIAVVAERGEVKISGSKDVHEGDGDSEDDSDDGGGKGTTTNKRKVSKDMSDKVKNGAKGKGKGKPGSESKKRQPRKYINLKLCALPPRTPGKSSSAAGDAMLQLLLFESDSIVREETTNEDGEPVVKRSYRGGSGGAYEKWCNLAVGSVIAILNPKVLRPLRAGSGAPHPLTMPLALNPLQEAGISIVGQASDIGCCTALQKDGNRCKTWVDLRQGPVCEYHVHAAVQRVRSGRAEFTAGNSSFIQPGGNKVSDSRIDHQKRTGMLPSQRGGQAAPRGMDNGGGGPTYIIGSSILHTGGSGVTSGNEFLSEKIGRNRASKRVKRAEEKAMEQSLQRLMENDTGSTGGRYLAMLNGKNGKKEAEDAKSSFSAEAVKKIGFDPGYIPGNKAEREEAAKRVGSKSFLRDPDKPVKLGKPRNFGLSSVRAPEQPKPLKAVGAIANPPGNAEPDLMVDLD